MYSFSFSADTDAYKAWLWRQFYYKEKKLYFEGGKKWKTAFFVVLPALMLLAYQANGNANNLIVAGVFSIGPLSWILLHILKRNRIKKQIKEFAGSKLFQITINDQEVCYQTDDANTTLQWGYFSQYEEFEDTFTLYAKGKGAAPVVLPLHGIAGNGPMKELVYQHVKEKIE